MADMRIKWCFFLSTVTPVKSFFALDSDL